MHSGGRQGGTIPSNGHRSRAWRGLPLLGLVAAASAAAWIGLGSSPSTGQSPQVSVYPEPRSGFASPQTQISIRGLAADQIGRVAVFGSRTGKHGGRLLAHSDGQGASFVPRRPFRTGEKVTVRTGLRVRRAERGDYAFRIGDFHTRAKTPGGGLPPEDSNKPKPLHFVSRPDLKIPRTLVVTPAHRTAPGYIFSAPKLDGSLIADDAGNPVWFGPVHKGKPKGKQRAVGIADFRAQTFEGKPVLTYWRGPFHTGGYTFGSNVILDQHYRLLARVRAGNGYHSDLHEFRLTARNTAYVTAYRFVRKDLRRFGGVRDGTVLDSIAQEVDVRTGLVVWEWHSLDHVGMKESGVRAKKIAREPYDYFHINSIADDGAGAALISARNTSALYQVNKATGHVNWRIGGRRSSFKKDGSGTTQTIGQHDAIRQPDGTLTVFDNGFVLKPVRKASRALVLGVDSARRRIRVRGAYRYPPTPRYPKPLLSTSQGSAQRLPNGDIFVGWGSRPVMTEFAPSGEVLYNALISARNSSYRAYRFPWFGLPAEPPAIATRAGNGGVVAWVSWNGDTRVRTWRLLTGPAPGDLHELGASPRTGFETRIAAPAPGPWVAMAGLDQDGTEIGRSPVVRVGGGSSPG